MLYLARGRGGGLIADLLPDWAALPTLVLIFVVLIGLCVYGRYKQRREGAKPLPTVNVALLRASAWGVVCAASLGEILGVISFFALGATWWVAVLPLLLVPCGVFLVQSAREAAEQRK
ncbi:hypothetical protein ACOKM3_07580 [Streptomyces sp. BH106]|uniref:hypothetical protein n=1 Tax=Streptomyces sp. BH106 TaxID=3410409 RepID=UPI003CE98311